MPNRLLPVPPVVGETEESAASGWEGETRDKTHVLRAGPTRDRRSSGILERSLFPKEREPKIKKRRPVGGGAADGTPKNKDSHSSLDFPGFSGHLV